MKPTTFAYISAPHLDREGLPAHRYKEYCLALYELGYIPIAPTLMFSRFLRESVPEQREARRHMSRQLLRRCRVLVLCSDEITDEMEAEIMLAKRLGIVATTLSGLQKISAYAGQGRGTKAAGD